MTEIIVRSLVRSRNQPFVFLFKGVSGDHLALFGDALVQFRHTDPRWIPHISRCFPDFPLETGYFCQRQGVDFVGGQLGACIVFKQESVVVFTTGKLPLVRIFCGT